MNAYPAARGEDPGALDTLALAQHRTGRTDLAVESEARALELLATDDPRRSEYAARLEEFRAALAAGATEGGR